MIPCFSRVRIAQSYVFCVVCCDTLFLVGFFSLNVMFSVQCFVITCFKWGSCCSTLCFLCSVLWYLACIRVPVAQSYIFCVVFCGPLFALGFVLLNLMFSV